MEFSDTTSWLSAKDAVKQFAVANGGPASVKAILADYLRDGELRARATRLWRTEAVGLSAAWRSCPPEHGSPSDIVGPLYIEIKPLTWRASKRWIADQADWRWPFNKFSITDRLKPKTRTMIEGIEFPLEDLENLLGKGNQKINRKGVGGRKTDLEKWRNFWHEIIVISKSGQLNTEHFSHQAALIAHIEVLISDAIARPGETALKEEVSRLWHKFVEPT